ncbi:MAG TPA: RsmE family RNA methyltransferase [Gemmatimonadales bacterium]
MIAVLVRPGGVAPGDVVPLGADEIHHLRVRRAGEDLPVGIRDGEGLVGDGVLRSAGHVVELVVARAERLPRPAPLRLAVGAGDRDRLGWLVEKATELGVTDIFPLETARVAGVESRLRGGQVERLRRRGLEAVKQCGAAWAPIVHEASSLEAFVAHPPEGARWLADIQGEPPPNDFGAGPLTVLVGPEGGLNERELAAIRAAGFRPVRLAGQVLRFETAAIAAAACAAAARLGGAHG